MDYTTVQILVPYTSLTDKTEAFLSKHAVKERLLTLERRTYHFLTLPAVDVTPVDLEQQGLDLELEQERLIDTGLAVACCAVFEDGDQLFWVQAFDLRYSRLCSFIEQRGD